MRMFTYSDNCFLFYVYTATAVHEIARRAMNGARLFLCCDNLQREVAKRIRAGGCSYYNGLKFIEPVHYFSFNNETAFSYSSSEYPNSIIFSLLISTNIMFLIASALSFALTFDSTSALSCLISSSNSLHI